MCWIILSTVIFARSLPPRLARPTHIAPMVMMAMLGAFILLPISLQNVLGPTTLQTGFLLLPGGLGLCAPAVGSLLDGAYSPKGGKHVAVMRSLTWLWNWLRNRPASAITYHRNRYILKRSRSLDELLL